MNKNIQPLLPERLPYPSHPALRALFRLPILLYRLGFGPLVGRTFMILTTTGRKSGLPRRTAIEHHTYQGRKYIMNGYGLRSDWCRNLLADSRVTVQTADGVERCRARRLITDEELRQAYGFVESSPAFRWFVKALGFEPTLEQFLAQKDRWWLMTFDPTDEPTPPPLTADLWWVTPLAVGAFIVVSLLAQRLGE